MHKPFGGLDDEPRRQKNRFVRTVLLWFWAAFAVMGALAALAFFTDPWPVGLLGLVAFAAASYVRMGVAVGGFLTGFGIASAALPATSHMTCMSVCTWTLVNGPAHIDDASAWQTETRVWLVAALVLVLVGSLISVKRPRALRAARTPLG